MLSSYTVVSMQYWACKSLQEGFCALKRTAFSVESRSMTCNSLAWKEVFCVIYPSNKPTASSGISKYKKFCSSCIISCYLYIGSDYDCSHWHILSYYWTLLIRFETRYEHLGNDSHQEHINLLHQELVHTGCPCVTSTLTVPTHVRTCLLMPLSDGKGSSTSAPQFLSVAVARPTVFWKKKITSLCFSPFKKFLNFYLMGEGVSDHHHPPVSLPGQLTAKG